MRQFRRRSPMERLADLFKRWSYTYIL
jgi:hypothetical protein